MSFGRPPSRTDKTICDCTAPSMEETRAWVMPKCEYHALNAGERPTKYVPCAHVDTLKREGFIDIAVPCNEPAEDPTMEWCEPLCRDHYAWFRTRPPRTELRFTDGHREMRSNFVYGPIYKDVETEFDGDSGNVLPIKTTWFERGEVFRDESGKVMLLFFNQIANPTPKQVAKANAIVRKGVTKRVSRWRKVVNRVRLWLALRGISA